MIYLRSTLYMLALAVLTPPFALMGMLLFPFDHFTRFRLITGWNAAALWLAKVLLGIRYEVVGRENLPSGPAVMLSKHQSAWETIAFLRLFPPSAFVLKRELLRLPFFGWGLAQLAMISIDRSAGKDALRQVLDQGSALLRRGFWVLIFPEGTRVAPGLKRRYKPGGAALAAHAGVPVVPVAHNAGECWPRQAFIKRPGLITVSIGPVIDTAGLDANEINARAEAWIEGEMHRISPHRYQGATTPDAGD